MILVTNNDTNSINKSLIRFNNQYIRQMNNGSNVDRYNRNINTLFTLIEKFQQVLESLGGHFNYTKPTSIEHSSKIGVVLAENNDLSSIEPCFEIIEKEFTKWNSELNITADNIAKTINTIGYAISGDEGGSDGSFSDLVNQYNIAIEETIAGLPSEQIENANQDAISHASSGTSDIDDEIRSRNKTEDEKTEVFDNTPTPTPGSEPVPGSDTSTSRGNAGSITREEEIAQLEEKARDADDIAKFYEDERDIAKEQLDNAREDSRDAQNGYNTAVSNYNAAKAYEEAIQDIQMGGGWPDTGETKGGNVGYGYSYSVKTNEDGTHTVTVTNLGGEEVKSGTYTYETTTNQAYEQSSRETERAMSEMNAASINKDAADKNVENNREAYNTAKEQADEARKEADEAKAKVDEAKAQDQAAHEAAYDYNTGKGNDYSPQQPPIDAGDDLDGNDLTGNAGGTPYL